MRIVIGSERADTSIRMPWPRNESMDPRADYVHGSRGGLERDIVAREGYPL